jgi:hypothetical protein
MTHKNDRIKELEEQLKRIELFLNGPPISNELFAAAHECERLARMVESYDNYHFLAQKDQLLETKEILRSWGKTMKAVESERRSQ